MSCADVHTGTDRVELTVCIPGQCCRGYCVDDTLHDLTKDQADRVRDVLAARVQALTVEQDAEPECMSEWQLQQHLAVLERATVRARNVL